jgi:hypothetical protein
MLLLLLWSKHTTGQHKVQGFRVLAISEKGGHHILYSQAARQWLDKLASDSGFIIDYIQETGTIDENLLAKYQLFIQLDYPPYGWKSTAVNAFEKFITEGKIGWIGFHHASLLGEFDGTQIWQWFSRFLGDIRFVNYIKDFANATVRLESKDHPVMAGVPSSFIIEKDEWYIYNKSPRPSVQVLANVDEESYSPSSRIRMGDHPVIWTNTQYKARNVYIFMGHDPGLFSNNNYTTIFRNAIFWAAGKNQ